MGNVLSIMEPLDPKGKEDRGAVGILAGALVAEPRTVAGFAESDSDRLILLKPFSEGSICFVGAGWSGDMRLGKNAKKWPSIVRDNTFDVLNARYSQQ